MSKNKYRPVNLNRWLIGLFFLASCNFQASADTYREALISLCDKLLSTQINNKTDSNYGALVCPSVNPTVNTLHSRAAEMVYPFAIAYKLTDKTQYRDAAINLGNWLTRIQVTSGLKSGGWSEVWPDPENKGWFGTTADQLVSLAGAFEILKPFLNEQEKLNWDVCIVRASEYIMNTFPLTNPNINYHAVGAAALVMANNVVASPQPAWLQKADDLMRNHLLDYVSPEGLLTGEGNGVDEGYNIAQSIGYIALYAILTNDEGIKQKAASLLRTHCLFVYPNGSVDNSWGTRSYKWTYESGTKTAPGIYFSFALLADCDPAFVSAGEKCLEYLNSRSMEDGWIVYGPHAHNHKSSNPPCNYSTFARAQSIALAVAYGPKIKESAAFSAQEKNWFHYFPDLKVAVVRTENIMATVSAYGEIRRYPRETVCRGGSISNLWFEGFSIDGYLQTSSSSVYNRIEPKHMPVENKLLPLTPRLEYSTDSSWFSNIFEANGEMTVGKVSNAVLVSTTGKLRTADGTSQDVLYSLTNKFYNDSVVKIITISGKTGLFSIVEPIVNNHGTDFSLQNKNCVRILTESGELWELKVLKSTIPFKIELGNNAEQYWCPFPGIEAFPVEIKFDTPSNAPQTIEFSIGMKR